MAEIMEQSTSPVNLGLDLDGLLDEATDFFAVLARIWPGKVIIISYRNGYAKAEADLKRLGILYDELILVDSFDGKAAVIVEKNVGIYFDDQPEMLQNIPEGVHVLLFRNGGNFDFEDQRWIFSNRTAKLI
ncbi:MAG: hypothetical protein KDA84_17380 [Planctomycetaceae bacterium]|nr:hypothetical protein [Planctomycetaceae bacterium]